MSAFPTARLKRSVILRNERANDESCYIGLEHVESWKGCLRPTVEAQSIDPSSARRYCAGDVLFGKLRPYLAKAVSAHTDGCCSSEFVVMRPTRYSGMFLKYLLLTPAFVNLVDGSTYGAKMPRANWEFIGDVQLPLPPLPTQKAIADFLDRKTAAIDALIEKKEKLLKLLAEKRAALIDDTLARLDAPMARLKHAVHLLPGYSFSSASFSTAESDIPLLRGVNIAPGRIRWDDVMRWPRDDVGGVQRYWLRPGDLVLGMDRPWIGSGLRLAAISVNDCPCLLLQRVARLRPKGNVLPDYLQLALEWKRFKAHLEPETTGVSVPHISGDQILSFPLPVPPLNAQKSVVDFVAKRISTMGRVGHRIGEQISLLLEYRQATITAAVTGQIETDGWEI